MAHQAAGRRRRPACRSGRIGKAEPVGLLPAPRSREAGLGSASRRWKPFAGAGNEPAMGGAERRPAIPLRRRGTTGRARCRIGARNLQRGSKARRGFWSRRPEQRRLSSGTAHLPSSRNQPAPRRDARYFRRSPAFSLFISNPAGGHLPSEPLIFTTACATAIAYAPCDLASMPELDWPVWCMDRQKPGTYLRNGDPVCTVLAEAAEPEAARAIVGERLAALREDLMTFGNEESAA